MARLFVSSGRRWIGGWSALLAAYAFVLNALLATTLLAATPPAKSLSGFEICAASDDTGAFDHADKTTKRAAIHCHLCLQSVSPAALPAAAAASVPLPVAITISFGGMAADAPPAERRASPHQPRGPPHLT